MFRTHVSCVIDAPVAQVWKVIRPFDSLSVWHPRVASCEIEGPGEDKIGCVRRIELTNGDGVVRETLLALSDVERCIVYDIIESPMPVSNYVAKIELHEITEGNRTFGRWQVEFDTPPSTRDEMIQTLQTIFRTGFTKLQRIVA